MPMWCSFAFTRQGELPVGIDPVGADPVVGVAGPVPGDSLGPGCVSGGGRCPVRQGPVRPFVVIDGGEGIQEGLQLADRGRLGGLGAEPVLQGLLKPLHFPLGLRVTGLAVLLPHPEAAQFGLEAVAAAPPAGESRREHEPVVRQC